MVVYRTVRSILTSHEEAHFKLMSLNVCRKIRELMRWSTCKVELLQQALLLMQKIANMRAKLRRSNNWISINFTRKLGFSLLGSQPPDSVKPPLLLFFRWYHIKYANFIGEVGLMVSEKWGKIRTVALGSGGGSSDIPEKVKTAILNFAIAPVQRLQSNSC